MENKFSSPPSLPTRVIWQGARAIKFSVTSTLKKSEPQLCSISCLRQYQHDLTSVMARQDLDPLKWGKNIIPLTSKVLDQPPCCVEFVPEKDPSLLSKYFVVGTYDLREEDIVPVEGAFENVGYTTNPLIKVQCTSDEFTSNEGIQSPTNEEVPKTKCQVWYGSLILCRLHIGVKEEEDTV